jgi:hypothetical protein
MITKDQPSWSDVTARGLTHKIVRPARPFKQGNGDVSLIGKIIYEHADLNVQILARKAASIVRQALTPGSVLFSFPPRLFKSRSEAYDLIAKQCGAVSGVRPISMYAGKASGDLLVEVKFVVPESTTKAVSVGVSVGDLSFKATPSTDSMSNSNLVHVKLNLLRIPDEETFVADLKRSLRYYGQVYQIKKFLFHGYFEGEISVLLDVSSGFIDDKGELMSSQPLANNLYLEEWDCFAAATFKGAAPVCHWCRLAGHIRDNCPDLANRKCFNCKARGHTSRFCKVEPLTEGEDLDAYIKVSAKTKAKSAPSVPAKDIIRFIDVESVVDEEELPDAPTLFASSAYGSAASKHAPIDIRLSMDCEEDEFQDIDSDGTGVGVGDDSGADDASVGIGVGVSSAGAGDAGVGVGVSSAGGASVGGAPGGGPMMKKSSTSRSILGARGPILKASVLKKNGDLVLIPVMTDGGSKKVLKKSAKTDSSRKAQC